MRGEMNSGDGYPDREKRTSRRVSASVPVSYATRGVAYEDFLQDISAGGVFIETRALFSVGQTLTLTFPLPGHHRFITVSGEIVRTSGDGIGVMFDEAVQDLLTDLQDKDF
jgi:Tfp pilus assembly protein PilZ